jgi:hypothetical protein
MAAWRAGSGITNHNPYDIGKTYIEVQHGLDNRGESLRVSSGKGWDAAITFGQK